VKALAAVSLLHSKTNIMSVHIDAENDGRGGEKDKVKKKRRKKKKTSTHREKGQGRESLGCCKLVTQQYVYRKGAH